MTLFCSCNKLFTNKMNSISSGKILGGKFGNLDKNILTTILTYLDLNDYINGVPLLCREICLVFIQNSEFIWRTYFSYEFLHLEYPDNVKEDNETWYLYFKKSFLIFKAIRYHWSKIVELTNLKTADPNKR